ncbi:MFS transporter [Eubacteriales bacterium OttesenSCG-928-N13]|nr:MFS transporter [Eubacteriales bacterium OttesenSCG-928-N13]
MKQQAKRYPWQFALHEMAFYLSSSVFMSFVSVYFKQRDLSTQQISLLMAMIPFISIFAQPLWGHLGDRTGSRSRLLRWMAVGAAISILLMRLSDEFWWLMITLTLFSAFYIALQPLGDAIILEALSEHDQPFGPIRLTGCLAFALSSLCIGSLLHERMNWVVYLTAITMGLVLLASFALPEAPGHQKTQQDAGFRALLQDKQLRGLLVLVMLLQATMGYFYSFYSIHFMTLSGANSTLLGWSYLISSLSEVPFLLLSDKLFEKLGSGKLLLIAALALTIRWLLLAMLSGVYIIMATQLLHGWGFVVIMVNMAKYVNGTVPESLRARGQMLLAVVGFGVARVVGTLGGGLLAGQIGMQDGFYAAAAVSALALILFAPKYLTAPPLNGNADP